MPISSIHRSPLPSPLPTPLYDQDFPPFPPRSTQGSSRPSTPSSLQNTYYPSLPITPPQQTVPSPYSSPRLSPHASAWPLIHPATPPVTNPSSTHIQPITLFPVTAHPSHPRPRSDPTAAQHHPSQSSSDSSTSYSSQSPSVSPDQATQPPTLATQWRTLFNYHHNYRLTYDQPHRQPAQLSTANLRDNLPWGDVLLIPKPSDQFRLYSQNINGLRLDSTGGDLSEISKFIQAYQIDIVGFSEVNLDTSKYKIKQILSDTLRRTFDAHQYASATSEIPFEGFYKPGGTMTTILDSIVSRFHSKYTDKLGRWSTLSLTGKKSRLLSFITIYQVVDSSTTGPFTAYQQQVSSLKLADRTITPRNAFIADFASYLRTLKSPDSAFIIMGDFNEVVGMNSAGFSKITAEFDLVDIMSHFHPIANEVPTYARGTKRLDYVFCTSNVLSSVTSCGIEPFNQNILSDHRGLFVDWDEASLFGTATSPMAPKSVRKLQSHRLQAKGNYILSLHEYCIKHNVFDRLHRLESVDFPSWSLANKLDRDITRGMLHAEKQCRQVGKDPWSPSLKKARIKVEIFKLSLSMHKHHRDYSSQISRLVTSYVDLIEVPDTVDSIKASLTQAQKELRSVLKSATSERKKFIQDKQRAATIASNPKEALKWRNLQKSEDIKTMYRKLRFISKNSDQRNGLSRIEVPFDPTDDPKKCTNWKTVDTPEEITQYLLERNQLHFGQAAGTPFTIPPLNVLVDFCASTTTSELILRGNYTNPELGDLTDLLLKHLSSKTPIDLLPPQISEADMQKKFSIWKESTSTSPSGRHLGHYRSLLPTELPEDPQSTDMNTYRAKLMAMHHSVINLALKNGKSYTRWQKVVNVMIEKDPGNPKIHRLRVIHLYEADYNLILALKSRSLIHHAEDDKLLNDSLYGARPGRTAHDPVALEETIAEITRLSRKPCIKNAEDATACYDRIIPGLGNLASRSHGLHRCVALVQGHTLEDVRYHLKTNLGITEENYTHCEIYPIYGTGQGSGNSPTVWLVISSVLFNCYESRAHGALFESPDRSISLQLYRVGFVDDTQSYINKFEDDEPPSPEEMIRLLTHDSQLWSDLLWASGGALELPKCLYHHWHYYFHPTGTPILYARQTGPDVVLSTGDRTASETVPFRSPYNAHKTLGYWKSPSGTQTTQFKILKTKCDNHARIVSTSALTRRDAWTYYFSMYLTSPGYPLQLSHFSPAQLHKLETKSLPAIISKCGFNRNTSRRVIYGPVRLNGGGFRPFTTEQGLGQTLYILKQWSSTLAPGRAQRIAVAWAQMNVGVSWSIFANVQTPLPHFESHWLRVLRDFLVTIKGSLRLDQPSVPATQRINDTHIMDHVLSSGIFTPATTKQVNYCRLFLQAITVSDITGASGTTLFPGIEKGRDSAWISSTTWHHTNQANPSAASWKQWQKALNLFATDGTLHTPLYQWLTPVPTQRRKWRAYLDPTADEVYLQNTGKYEVHRRGRYAYDFETATTVYKPPPHAIPVDLQDTLSGWRVSSRLYPDIPIPQTPPVLTFSDACSRLEAWESQLLQSVQLLKSPEEIMEAIQPDGFSACSDGSAVFRQGTYGWVLSTPSKDRLAFGAGPVDGHDPQSFRAEGQGMLSVVCFLRHLKIWTKTDSPISGILATDNSGLITRVKEQSIIRYPVPNAIFQPDWDIVEAIVITVETADIDPTYTHVKGHQDKDKSYDKLPFLAQLNVDADKHAGDYRIAHGQYRPVIPLSPTRPISLDLDGKTIHRNYKSAIRDAAHSQPLIQRIVEKNCWLQTTPDLVDWDAHRLATANPQRRTHFVKLCHGYLPTGKLVHRYNPKYPDWCPLCKQPDEDHKHVLRCTHPSRTKWRSEFFKKVRSRCNTMRTDPILTSILIGGLQTWLDLTPFDSNGIPDQYQSLLDQQNEIGWYNVFLGRLSLQWARLQSQFLLSFDDIPRSLGGDKWTKQIASVILESWLDLWKQRNLDRHGRDSAHQKLALHEQVMREIDIMYTYKNKVLQRDHSIFDLPLDQIKDKPHQYLRQWLNTHQTVILHSAASAKRLSLLDVRNLQQYFPAQLPPPH